MANIGQLQEERVFLRHAPMRWTSLENQNRRHCRELNRGPYFGGEAGGGGAPWGGVQPQRSRSHFARVQK